jgi:hypothetical protein
MSTEEKEWRPCRTGHCQFSAYTLLTGCSETVRSISGSKLPSRGRRAGQIVYEKHVETRPALAAIERVQGDSAPCLLLTAPRYRTTFENADPLGGAACSQSRPQGRQHQIRPM